MSWRIKVIENIDEYKEANTELERLIGIEEPREPEVNERIKIISILVEAYDRANYDLEGCSPAEAIKIRMDDLNFTQADLSRATNIPQSHISDIILGKRQLNTPLVKKISIALDMPVEILIGPQNDDSNLLVSSQKFGKSKLIKQMTNRGYFGSGNNISDKTIIAYFNNLNNAKALLRRTRNRVSQNTDALALMAWLKKIEDLASSEKYSSITKFNKNNLTEDFIENLVHLSTNEDKGVKEVIGALNEKGIIVVVEPHLDKTKLDGALDLNDPNHPIIGLTLRYDRIDNFWFTIMHELSHLFLHRDIFNKQCIFDELYDIKNTIEIDEIEKEADEFASKMLIKPEIWESSSAKNVPSAMSAVYLANTLNIDPSIVAGRMRSEGGKWRYLSSMVNFSVRQYFNEIDWKGDGK